MQLEEYGSDPEVCNAPNYTVGVAVSKYMQAFKIELGFAYATKNYTFKSQNELAAYDKTDVELQYYFIPLMLSRRLFTDTKNTFSLGLGAVFLKPFRYKSQTFYKDGTMSKPDATAPVDYKTGTSVRLGISYSRQLFASDFMIFTEVYGDYKFNMDYNEPGSSIEYSDLTDDRFDMGVNIGIEWLFTRAALPYYSGN